MGLFNGAFEAIGRKVNRDYDRKCSERDTNMYMEGDWDVHQRANLIKALAHIRSGRELPTYDKSIDKLVYFDELVKPNTIVYSLSRIFEREPETLIALISTLYYISPVYLNNLLEETKYKEKEDDTEYKYNLLSVLEILTSKIRLGEIKVEKSEYVLGDTKDSVLCFLGSSYIIDKRGLIIGSQGKSISRMPKEPLYKITLVNENTVYKQVTFTHLDLLKDITGFEEDYLEILYKQYKNNLPTLFKTFYEEHYLKGEFYTVDSLYRATSEFIKSFELKAYEDLFFIEENITENIVPFCKYKVETSSTTKDINFDIDKMMNMRFLGATIGSIFTQLSLENVHKYNANNKGHGLAFEDAQNFIDRMKFRNARVVGGNNAKHGADRVVNGINIQSKCCKSGKACIDACFENGRMKYINPDGSPMAIEVPKDKYDEAINTMKEKIKKGEVPGVTDPEKASELVKQGFFTYEQIKEIAKAGNITSLIYDAAVGAVEGFISGSISAVITFAISIYRGDTIIEASKNAFRVGFAVFGQVFITYVLTSQLFKSELGTSITKSVEELLKKLSPDLLKKLEKILGLKDTAGMARTLTKTATIFVLTVIIYSALDFKEMLNGRMSSKQMFINTARTTINLGATGVGFTVGTTLVTASATTSAGITALTTTAGTAVCPVMGTLGGLAVGLIVSSIAGMGANKFCNATIDKLEGDSKLVVDLFKDVFAEQAEVFLLTEAEVYLVIKKLNTLFKTKTFIGDVMEASNKNDYLVSKVRPTMEEIARLRLTVNSNIVIDLECMEQVITEFENQELVSLLENTNNKLCIQ